MNITRLDTTGTAAKFQIVLSRGRGEFMLSLSATLCNLVWKLSDDDAKLDAATQMASAIVGRHDPNEAFRDKYIFGDHNTEDTLEKTVQHLHRTAI
jgi:hypothetical protein